MIKRSPSRNHRSKGIKVKHVLQIIVLVGVCFWLIYQVKHSHDKKKEFDEKDAKGSIATQASFKLGRKDLHPGKDEVNQNDKHEEEEEDDSIIEDEDKHEHNEHDEEGNLHETEEKGDNKHGVKEGEEEQEEDENKSEENEDERGAGDDEIDEDDQDKSAVDIDHDEEFGDEEKEKEMEDVSNTKENENNKDEEKEGSVENHNSHEAREEQYNGDDASSAVTHDTHTTNTETETVSLQNSDVNSETSITKSENKPNYTEEIIRNQPSTDINITKVVLTGGTPSNATSGDETGNNSLSNNTTNVSHLNNTTMTYPDSHSEAGNNLTVVIPGGSNNMTGTGADASSEQNKMVMFSESIQAQNDTAKATVTGDVKNIPTERGLDQRGNRVSEENLPNLNSTVPVKTENSDAGAGESSNLEGGELEKSKRSIASNETESKGNTETSETDKTQDIPNSKDSIDATKDDELKGDRQTGETSDSDLLSENRTSNSDILKDVAKVQADLDLLPRIRNEGDNVDGATATN